jgi:hypothetical protein
MFCFFVDFNFEQENKVELNLELIFSLSEHFEMK